VNQRVPSRAPALRHCPIFINYRNDDEPFAAVLVDHALSSRFGPRSVFRASRCIGPGADYELHLVDAVRGAAVLLAIIGPRWITAANGEGIRRLDQPMDWVRREIAEAFQHNARVVPVLLDTKMPSPTELPSAIAQLSRCQYVRLHHRNSVYDLERLTTEVARIVPSLGRPRRSPWRERAY
jgi:hypothetical protein